MKGKLKQIIRFKSWSGAATLMQPISDEATELAATRHPSIYRQHCQNYYLRG